MTNRSSIFGAFAWVLVAATLVGTALQPVSASSTCAAACVPSAASGTASCALAA